MPGSSATEYRCVRSEGGDECGRTAGRRGQRRHRRYRASRQHASLFDHRPGRHDFAVPQRPCTGVLGRGRNPFARRKSQPSTKVPGLDRHAARVQNNRRLKDTSRPNYGEVSVIKRARNHGLSLRSPYPASCIVCGGRTTAARGAYFCWNQGLVSAC